MDLKNLLFDLRDILDYVAPDDEANIRRGLAALSDELNASLPDYEVSLLHLDGADYLSFAPIAEQGDYWTAMAAAEPAETGDLADFVEEDA
jgi:hypothetical protein